MAGSEHLGKLQISLARNSMVLLGFTQNSGNEIPHLDKRMPYFDDGITYSEEIINYSYKTMPYSKKNCTLF